MATDERNRTEGCCPPPFPEDFGERLEETEGYDRAAVG